MNRSEEKRKAKRWFVLMVICVVLLSGFQFIAFTRHAILTNSYSFSVLSTNQLVIFTIVLIILLPITHAAHKAAKIAQIKPFYIISLLLLNYWRVYLVVYIIAIIVSLLC